MRYYNNILTLLIFLVLVFISPKISSGAITPEQFAGHDGLLNEKELIDFFLVYEGVTFKTVWNTKVSESLIAAKNGDVEQAKKKMNVLPILIEMQKKLGTNSPYKPIQVNAYLQKSYQKEDSNWMFDLRLRQKFEDWDKNPKDVNGSSISYSDDRLEDNQTWVTQGSLIYPIKFFSQSGQEDNNETRNENYRKIAFLPTIKWNYLSLSKDDDKDTEELIFQLPWFARISHKKVQATDTSKNPTGLITWASEFYLTPFYSTDFDFDGELIGVSLTYEPIIQIGERFQTGSWHSISGTFNYGYLFRIIPGINYSHVLTEGPFVNREENDDMLGITTSFELGIQPFGKNVPWEIRASYDMLYDFTGESDGYFDKWGAKLTYWFAQTAGLNLEYQKGDQFLTKKEIELVTLGLQVRF